MGGSKNKSPAQKEKLQKRGSDTKDTKKTEKGRPKITHKTSVKFLPGEGGYVKVNLTVLSGAITNKVRTVCVLLALG